MKSREDISVRKVLQAGAHVSYAKHAQAVNGKPGALQSLLQAVKSGLDLSITYKRNCCFLLWFIGYKMLEKLSRRHKEALALRRSCKIMSLLFVPSCHVSSPVSMAEASIYARLVSTWVYVIIFTQHSMQELCGYAPCFSVLQFVVHLINNHELIKMLDRSFLHGFWEDPISGAGKLLAPKMSGSWGTCDLTQTQVVNSKTQKAEHFLTSLDFFVYFVFLRREHKSHHDFHKRFISCV